jgi:probable HAF family extracellular repeat protein
LMNVSNELGQITGGSYTNATPNPATGMPTLDPFLWDNGHMQDLGTLGGTIGIGNWLNNHGEVAGFSDLTGDQTSHPFLWNGKRMIDLGTLGGDNGNANWVNDAGHVVGSADLPSGTHDGFLWADGTMRALAPVNGALCSNANSVNNRDEVVGNGTNCHGNELAAVLWSHGVPFDLNSLTAPSGLHLASAEYISGQGEIVGHGTLADGSQRVFLLIPNQGVPLPFASAAAARSSHDRLRRTHRRSLTAKAGLGGRRCRSRPCALLRVRDMRR